MMKNSQPEVEEKRPKLSIVADGMKVSEFARFVAGQAEVSVVVEESLDDRIVDLDVTGESVDAVLDSVARRLGVETCRSGNLYFLGTIKPEDKGVLVRRCGRLTSEQIRDAVSTLATDATRTVVDVDGLVIVGDRIQVLRRVNELIDSINVAATRTWVVQVYMVGLSQMAVDELAAQLNPTFGASLTATVPGPSPTLSMEFALDVLLDYEASRSDVDTCAAPTFVCRDGVASRVFVGDRIPVPRRAISDQGTSTVQGFDQVEAGLSVECEVREAGAGEAILRLAVERSRIKGNVEGNPILGSENFDTSAVVGRRGVYLLGELERSDSEQTEGGRWRFGERDTMSYDVIQIWARVDSIYTGSEVSSSLVQREASPAAMSGETKSVPRSGSDSGGNNVGANGPPAEPSVADKAERGPTLVPPAKPDTSPDGGWRSVPVWPPVQENKKNAA